MTTPKWLTVVAQRSGEHTWTLGHVFARYLQHEGRSREELAAELDCSREVLDWLSVCRRPEEEHFVEHLRRIEQRFGVDPRRLAVVIRRVEVLEVLPADGEGGDAVRDDAYLLAARDHSSDDEKDS